MNKWLLASNFSVFVLVGLIFFVLAVGLNWLAVDLLHLNSFLAPLAIISVLFVLKYYVYLLTRTIVPKFFRYVLANSVVTLVSTVTISILVTHLSLQGWISSIIALGFFTVLRYALLFRMKVIDRESGPIEKTLEGFVSRKS